MIRIENHHGIMILRDDLLPGGTKSILLEEMMNDPEKDEFIYASPVFGAFQIALSIASKIHGKKATIFTAKRKEKHPHTKLVEEAGAKLIEIDPGYLTVVEKRAKDYAIESGGFKIPFGGKIPGAKEKIRDRMKAIIREIGSEPEEIWCAVGSGTLLEGILEGSSKAEIHGVVVGAEYRNQDPRVRLHRYGKAFHQESKFPAEFPSMANYDRKALEICDRSRRSDRTLFWNVY